MAADPPGILLGGSGAALGDEGRTPTCAQRDSPEARVTPILLILILGFTTMFWSLVGLGRLASFHVQRGRRSPFRRPDVARSEDSSHDEASSLGPIPVGRLTRNDVAVLVAAHNEELVIAETMRVAGGLIDSSQIFVASDGSTDATAAIVRSAGAQVLEVSPNRGKAGALAAAIEHFRLCERFEVVLLLDADTHLAPDYLESALPLFDDPEVVAVAARARTLDSSASPSRFGRFILAYRERFYVIVQVLMKFGQAAKWANAVSIVPGFASMYRTRALREIEITAPGLVIEDFNMTFEVHARKLGRIEFLPWAAVAYTQDPDHLGEYIKQVRRWILGFWQTARRHHFHFSVFWVALLVFMFELVTASLMFVLVIPAMILTLVAGQIQTMHPDPTSWSYWLSGLLQPQDVLIGVLLPDFILTVFAACLLRSPRYLLLGLGFPLMRMLDAALCLWMLPKAFRGRSSGVWVSPTRRAESTGPAPQPLLAAGARSSVDAGAVVHQGV